MRALIKGGDKRERIDRAFLRGDRWRAAHIERLGLEPDPDALDDPYLFVSDHFGLCVDLVPRD